MQRIEPKKLTTLLLAVTAPLIIAGSALALETPPHKVGANVPPTGASDSSTSTSNSSQHLSQIKQKGDAEITRRLKTLNTLDGKISAAAKLNSGDKASLTTEVNDEISGLTALKTKLDAETTLDAAITDAKSIISDYRVYALIVPKVMLIKTADDQQAVQAKLTTLSDKLKTRLDSASSGGKDVTSLQSTLDDLNAQVSAAAAISSSVETKVLSLQPSDYDSDHTILSGYRGQLQTAHSNDQKAIADAKTIVSGLKSL